MKSKAMRTRSCSSIAEEAVDRILAAREQGRRSSNYHMTFLNRSPRTLRSIRKWHDKACVGIGMNQELIERQWEIVKELAELEARAVE